MFKKVLIANRGEIAVRIAHTLQQMGIRTATVFSDPDRCAVHALCADEAYALPGESSADTYLRGDRIVELAREHGVDAIHPGYGFLSENAAFAQRCCDAGITFIGPTPAVMTAMGDKIIAKQTMEKAGVPVVPGITSADPSIDELAARAKEMGYPVLIKAAAGGGGKGMRVVTCEDELQRASQAAQREASSAFADGRIFLEKYIEKPRHVEVQIFGDNQGNVCHIFERECSIQRRHQKIIEETPATALPVELRREMGEAAVRAAQAIGYTNAGTVEFLVDATGAFYFLEVNTRLQVEHAVTEATTGLDLVRVQVEVAAGQPLPFRQEDLQQRGHAIECRIYAEDPDAGFLPSVGTIARFVPPAGLGVRVDSGVRTGCEVTVHYDPMLAKLICWGATRDEALDRMLWSLDRFVVLGVSTNIAFLRELLRGSAFRSGRVHTHLLDEHPVVTQTHADEPALIAAAIACELGLGGAPNGAATPSAADAVPSPWQSAGGWRLKT